jgi:ubiquinone/menaquinone biosynthesis C-methylase UbiE
MLKFFTDRTPPSRADIARIYDERASDWLRREGRAESRVLGRWRQDLVSRLQGDVLELGIAAGDTLIRLRDYDHAVTSYTGIDLSAEMIRQAEYAAEELDLPVSLHVADAEDLSLFGDNSFDTIAASLVFCTIPDIPKALAEVARLCKPDGRIVFLEHVLSSNRVVATIQRLLAPIHLRRMGCYLDRTTVETFEAHGFRIEEHQRRYVGVLRLVVARSPD